ncbi:acyl-CoA-binding domain-containing protein 6 [Diabrotica virgifera virgifera]|uniref:Acyl-CoA-binding domain-containing protein 6 n=1 Tax=Diabrotica virgifera virgifera TaxID=50390 RepID=A0A6P7GW14_DIAVI|nr:acyl-CoA-binding domain-containing protein 6 [Diabrotica virgifera virgifera]
MADAVDNFSDLQELGIDINEEDSLTISFNKAASHLQKLLPNVDNQTLLTLYGYYKQGTEGTCTTSKPSWYDLRAKSKWDAWNKLGDLPQKEAKTLYIDTLKKLDPTFDDAPLEKSEEQWIKVSSMSKDEIPQSELTVIDYIKENNVKEVRLYLKTNQPDLVNDGLSLIHWAADGGSSEILKLLIDAGADVNIKDSDGQTALHYAASCGHTDCVKLLLQKGANKEITDNDGCTPHSVASENEILELLN